MLLKIERAKIERTEEQNREFPVLLKKVMTNLPSKLAQTSMLHKV